MVDWPAISGAHFPIPRISESFVDQAVAKSGGKRIGELWAPPPGIKSADYVFPGTVAELKILEEEGLEKTTRQDKLARLFLDLHRRNEAVELDFEALPFDIAHRVDDLLLEPIQGAVRKAAKQLKETRTAGPFKNCCSALIAVNSGYSSIPASLFEKLVLRSCKKDTSQIDVLVCLSVHYHQGNFDCFVFFKRKAFSVKRRKKWPESEDFMNCATAQFNEAMDMMMRDQMNPELWAKHLEPVRDIVFERGGVTYVRRAPEVPDSRFSE